MGITTALIRHLMLTCACGVPQNRSNAHISGCGRTLGALQLALTDLETI